MIENKILHRVTGSLEFPKKDIVIEFTLSKQFKTYKEAYEYSYRAFFEREKNKIVLKVINPKTKEIIEEIKEKDCKLTVHNDSLRGYRPEELYKDYPELMKGFLMKLPEDYIPLFSCFKKLFENNNISLEYGEKYYIECESWEAVEI